MKATLRLFNALPIEDSSKKANPSKQLLAETTKRGFVFAPEVVGNYSENELIQIANKSYKTATQWNQSFHKSWKKVRDASIEQLVMEQVIHYFTTYGLESIGLYNEDSVYIPNEYLEVPDIDRDCYRFIVIKGLTKKELKKRTLDLLGSGIALGEETVDDVTEVLIDVGIDEKEILAVKNKEVRCILYSMLNRIPRNNVEFLRYLVYTATDSALLIKSPAVIAKIKANEKKTFFLLIQYEKEVGLESLAEIFNRFKPIFLALKHKRTARLINRIRRLAKKLHKPMPEDYLNAVTSKIKNGVSVTNKQLTQELKKVNCFRKIRLAYALNHRAYGTSDSIMYQIRNGKGFTTDFSFDKKEEAESVLQVVLDSIAADVANNVGGKKVFVPDFVEYAMPSTEKQFVGNVPGGTCIKTEGPMVCGVHWFNVDRHRIDLDLALLNQKKIGWDGYYRDGADVLFSGDITDAPKPKGASELFRIAPGSHKSFLVTLNYYNYSPDVPVPYDIVVGQDGDAVKKSRHFTLDPNDMLVSAESQIEKRQQLVGLLTSSHKECKFYFCGSSVGNRITSSVGPTMQKLRSYLFDYSTHAIGLGEILNRAGAVLCDDAEDADIDLSIEKLDKTTILDLFKK